MSELTPKQLERAKELHLAWTKEVAEQFERPHDPRLGEHPFIDGYSSATADAQVLVEALEMNSGTVHYPQKILEALASYRGEK